MSNDNNTGCANCQHWPQARSFFGTYWACRGCKDGKQAIKMPSSKPGTMNNKPEPLTAEEILNLQHCPACGAKRTCKRRIPKRENKDDWPAGQEWDDLGNSSKWSCVREGLQMLDKIAELEAENRELKTEVARLNELLSPKKKEGE